MAAFTHHIFVCCNTREPGHPRGCCDPSRSQSLRNQLKIELKKRGLKGQVRANMAGCLDQCEHGPNLVIYPQGIWYGGVRLEDVPRIIDDTIIHGMVIEDLLIAPECLDNPHCHHRSASCQLATKTTKTTNAPNATNTATATAAASPTKLAESSSD